MFKLPLLTFYRIASSNYRYGVRCLCSNISLTTRTLTFDLQFNSKPFTLLSSCCQTNFNRHYHHQHYRQQQSSNLNKKWILFGFGAFVSILAFDHFKTNEFRLLTKAYSFSLDENVDNNSKKKSKNAKYSNMNFIADIVEQVSRSVVFIQSSGRHPLFPNSYVNISSGSGFLVDKSEGIILTNAHVIANARKVSVHFNDGRVVEGNVEFADYRHDLATVRVPNHLVKDIDMIPLGDSKQSRAGEWVIAVGSPFSLSNTVTVGVISSISRAGRELGIHDDIDYIQTDASINVGNSGGPLLNLDGEAIGINTLKVGEGISFAIPSFYALEFLRRCEKTRESQNRSSWWHSGSKRQGADSIYGNEHNEPIPKRKKYLGATIITLTPNLIEHYRARDRDFPDVEDGVLIFRVVLGSPAHLEGLRSGDIIQAINGQKIKQSDDVYRMLETAEEFKFLIRRRNEEILLRIKPQCVE